MKVLFLFLDGVGLGSDDPQVNPLAFASMPNLEGLLGGKRLLIDTAPYEGPRASLIALDAQLNVPGLPQSATGQATLLTGRNIPAVLGYHYGPKPNPEIAAEIRKGSLFSRFRAGGLCCALLNAYPPRYFQAIQSGRRLYSAIPLALTEAGISLKTEEDYYAGNALAADFTGQGWRSQLGYKDSPILEPAQAGRKMAELSNNYDFSFFEYWVSDYAGHYQDMRMALDLLATFDGVLSGLLSTWDDNAGLILVTSDHGNMEDLSSRRHTLNPVPALLIGSIRLRRLFTTNLVDLAGIAPSIEYLFNRA